MVNLNNEEFVNEDNNKRERENLGCSSLQRQQEAQPEDQKMTRFFPGSEEDSRSEDKKRGEKRLLDETAAFRQTCDADKLTGSLDVGQTAQFTNSAQTSAGFSGNDEAVTSNKRPRTSACGIDEGKNNNDKGSSNSTQTRGKNVEKEKQEKDEEDVVFDGEPWLADTPAPSAYTNNSNTPRSVRTFKSSKSETNAPKTTKKDIITPTQVILGSTCSTSATLGAEKNEVCEKKTMSPATIVDVVVASLSEKRHGEQEQGEPKNNRGLKKKESDGISSEKCEDKKPQDGENKIEKKEREIIGNVDAPLVANEIIGSSAGKLNDVDVSSDGKDEENDRCLATAPREKEHEVALVGEDGKIKEEDSAAGAEQEQHGGAPALLSCVTSTCDDNPHTLLDVSPRHKPDVLSSTFESLSTKSSANIQEEADKSSSNTSNSNPLVVGSSKSAIASSSCSSMSSSTSEASEDSGDEQETEREGAVRLFGQGAKTPETESSMDTQSPFFWVPDHLRDIFEVLLVENCFDPENIPLGSSSLMSMVLHRHRSEESKDVPPKVFSSFDIDGVVEMIKGRSNIIVMVGAGLSTAAGIPDFRSPGTGLYDNLQKYDLPEPEALFTLKYFRDRPDPFYDLCGELWPDPDNYKPTLAHYFVTLLENKRKLLRCYSQNIDSLEELAGLSSDALVAAHGNFSQCHGIDTKISVPTEEVKRAVTSKNWRELVERYGELVKPDIVFFGEELPQRFRDLVEEDFPKCDLLLVLGTSLAVAPFNQLISCPERTCPRVLVNRDEVGTDLLTIREPFRFDDETMNYRDVFLGGDLNDQVRELCKKLEWMEELEALMSPKQGASKDGVPKEAAKDVVPKEAAKDVVPKEAAKDIVPKEAA